MKWSYRYGRVNFGPSIGVQLGREMHSTMVTTLEAKEPTNN